MKKSKSCRHQIKIKRWKCEISAENLIRHEIIGLKAVVAESLNSSLVELSGVIVDESRNTITLKKSNGVTKVVPKDVCIFELELPSGVKVRVDGRMLVGRPEERIKMKRRKVVWPVTIEKQLRNIKFQPVRCEVMLLDS